MNRSWQGRERDTALSERQHYEEKLEDLHNASRGQLSSDQNVGWLDYIPDYTTQIYASV